MKEYLKKNAFYFVWKRIRRYDRNEMERYVENYYRGKEYNLSSIKRSMLLCYLLGGVRYSDFYQMRFEEKSLKEKMKFIPRSAELNLYNQVNAKKYVTLLEDKGECYKLFQKYYRRDVVKVSKEDIKMGEAINVVTDFTKKHKRYMIKPLSLYCGIGIRILDKNDPNNSIKDLINSYQNGFVLEELIKQSKMMSSLHSSSVNSVRIITVNYGNSIEIKWPFLRVGRGDAIVDNAGAGGIIVAIDNEGKTFAAGDENRNSYKVHPETKVSLIGFEIPEWEKLCKMCKEMAATCPDCHIMGWDMAYSDGEEWVVVECNYGPNIVSQFVTGQGIRDEFVKVRKRLGAKRFGKFSM